ncbi:hypothetical protein [Saccharopolyspora sp. CA-218241]|uniref:hypothetical protein n=1 Tax=Saccharopolyspora sp. CA-218241 TaxID=3240027 RepID=UPI003D99E28E
MLDQSGRSTGEVKVPKRWATGGTCETASATCGMTRTIGTISRSSDNVPIERLSAGCSRSRRVRRPSAERASGVSWCASPPAVT